MKSWYIIDWFPFENPNIAVNHVYMYRATRWACLMQPVYMLIYYISHDSFYFRASDPLLRIVAILRFGVVCPGMIKWICMQETVIKLKLLYAIFKCFNVVYLT